MLPPHSFCSTLAIPFLLWRQVPPPSLSLAHFLAARVRPLQASLLVTRMTGRTVGLRLGSIARRTDVHGDVLGCSTPTPNSQHGKAIGEIISPRLTIAGTPWPLSPGPCADGGNSYPHSIPQVSSVLFRGQVNHTSGNGIPSRASREKADARRLACCRPRSVSTASWMAFAILSMLWPQSLASDGRYG